MTASKYWLPKLLFVTLIIFGGIYFLSQQIFHTEVKKPNLVPEVLAESSTSQPLEPLVQPVFPTVQVSQSPGSVADFSVSIPVLMYHYVRTGVAVTDQMSYQLSVAPEMLDQQLSYLHDQGFQTISLSDLDESLSEGTPLPPKSVILTFDDGYRDFYTSAFPLLKKYNLRAVSFYIVGYSNYPTYMNWDMVKEIHNSGLVDVESHTLSHFLLTKLPLDQQRKEIFDSKKTLEEILHKKVNYFAYPYGDFNQQVLSLAAEAGYKLAFGTDPGLQQKSSEKLSLKRITISGFDNFDKFVEKLGQPKPNPAPDVPKQAVPQTASSSPQTTIPR